MPSSSPNRPECPDSGPPPSGVCRRCVWQNSSPHRGVSPARLPAPPATATGHQPTCLPARVPALLSPFSAHLEMSPCPARPRLPCLLPAQVCSFLPTGEEGTTAHRGRSLAAGVITPFLQLKGLSPALFTSFLLSPKCFIAPCLPVEGPRMEKIFAQARPKAEKFSCQMVPLPTTTRP